jgi:hypothetical protein
MNDKHIQFARTFFGARLPNWLALTFILIIVRMIHDVPQVISTITELTRRHLDTLGGTRPPMPNWHLVLAQIPSVAETFPEVALLVALIAMLFPQTRSRWVEARFHLAPDAEFLEFGLVDRLVKIKNAINDMGLLHNVSIKSRLADAGIFCFVYPKDRANQVIAIGGGFLKVMRRNADLATTLLRHEFSHIVRGESFVIGVGSFLEFVVRNWIIIFLLSYFAPACLIAAGNIFVEFGALEKFRILGNEAYKGVSMFEMWILKNEVDPSELDPDKLRTSWVSLRVAIELNAHLWWQGIHGGVGYLVFQHFSYFVLPLIGIWSAEFIADRMCIRSRADLENYRAWLISERRRMRVWEYFFSGLSHPPYSIRLLMLKIRSQIMFEIIMLLLPIIALNLVSLSLLLRETFLIMEGLGDSGRLRSVMSAYYRDMMLMEVPITGLFLMLWGSLTTIYAYLAFAGVFSGAAIIIASMIL